MSAALVVYSVPWEELLAVPNSRRRKFVTEVGRKFGGRLKRIDEIFLDFDPPPSSREALRQIVYGEELDPRLGELYANAVEVICLHLGSSYQAAFAPREITELDKLLKRRKCPVEVSDLAYRGSPIPIPSDEISIGYWDPRQVQEAHSFFWGTKLPRAEELSRQFVLWLNILEEALGHDEDGLVGFVY